MSSSRRLTDYNSYEINSPFLLRSLILVVVLVFGCIVVSFVLSSLKQRHDIESWTMMAGTAFNHLVRSVRS